MLLVLRARWLLVALAVCTAGCHRTLAPSPNLYVHVETAPFADVPPAHRTTTVDLMYATDRKQTSAPDAPLTYGHDRNAKLAYGNCRVQIGSDGFTWDELVAASRTDPRHGRVPVRVEEFEEVGRFPQTPPKLGYRDGELRVTPEYEQALAGTVEHLHGELRRRLALGPRKDVFIYVHGVMNSIERAAGRYAELWHFLGRIGVPVLYSWPAGNPGMLRGYIADRESSEFTVYHLRDFITAVASCPEVERINLIGHSRGTDVVMEALSDLTMLAEGADVDLRETYKINHVIIAAPDIDYQLMRQRDGANRVFRSYEHLTMYVTPKDRALLSAEWLHASPNRIGKLRPERLDHDLQVDLDVFKKKGNTIIDSRVSTDFLGHEYFMDSPASLSDIILVLHDDRLPGAEHGRPLTEILPAWYILDDDYPMKAAPLPPDGS